MELHTTWINDQKIALAIRKQYNINFDEPPKRPTTPQSSSVQFIPVQVTEHRSQDKGQDSDKHMKPNVSL